MQKGYYPYPAVIESYGKGGFRFAEMSHTGSLLFLPSGVWEWPVADVHELTFEHFAKVQEDNSVRHLLIGTGEKQVFLKADLLEALHKAGFHPEVMTTGAAARTYNILLQEGRNIGAALIAV